MNIRQKRIKDIEEVKMDYEIIHLKKDEWKGTIIPIGYSTNEYYDVNVIKNIDGYNINLKRELAKDMIVHTPEEYNFPDRLYDYEEESSYAWGIVEDEKLVACIETVKEEWNKRLRIKELWVDDSISSKGIGTKLINLAKERLIRERLRALVLETQSCNVRAIDFYLKRGFTLTGLDTLAYSNNDINRREVRLEFGWIPPIRTKINKEKIEIREEKEEDYFKVEDLTRNAFWNKHGLGCDEHYLVHKLREHKDYIKDLSKVAIYNGDIVGTIMYSKSFVLDETLNKHEVLTFGPLCIEPKYQGIGIGESLLKDTIIAAKDANYKAIIIFGEPDYYPRLGFKTCDNFGITTSDGENFDAFMCYELNKGSLNSIKGKFYASEVFYNLPKDEVEDFDKKFRKLEKISFPDQWE
jgi:predicted N-acetyltransferase YhbS